MSSFSFDGSYGAPQLVTFGNPEPNQEIVELVTTIAGVTTTLESLRLQMEMIHGFVDSACILVLEYLDQTGNVIYHHAVRCPITPS